MKFYDMIITLNAEFGKEYKIRYYLDELDQSIFITIDSFNRPDFFRRFTVKATSDFTQIYNYIRHIIKQ